MPTPVFRYAFGPFALESEIELPELAAGDASGLPVTIRLGTVPATVASPTFQTLTCSASPHELLLTIPGIAAYWIRDGVQVVVQPDSAGDLLDMRGYLLGNIFAVLCHQRRLLPLHASAVRMGGGAVAFLADSGSGKSTLAAFLVARGHPLVADDICLLDPDAPDAQRVIPVAPWLKLWRTSLEALGQGQVGLSRTFQDEDKYRLPAAHLAQVERERLPLAALVFLERDDRATGSSLQVLPAAQTMVRTMRFTYQQYLLNWLGLQEQHFTRCSLAVGRGRAFTCARPWGFNALEDVARQLEQRFASPG